MEQFETQFTYLLGSLAMATALSSCSTRPIIESPEAPSTASACCESLADARMVSLSLESRTVIVLDSKANTYKTQAGNAYFAGFQIARGTQTIELQAMYGDYLPSASFVDPIVVFLDHNKNVLVELQQLPLEKGFHTVMGVIRQYYAGARVKVPPLASFVLIVANSKSTRRFRTYSDAGKAWDLPTSPEGKVAILAR